MNEKLAPSVIRWGKDAHRRRAPELEEAEALRILRQGILSIAVHR